LIGFLHIASRDSFGHLIDAYQRGLNESGYVVGTNVTIEYRWADNHIDRLPALAADLVSRKVSVIAALGGLATPRAAKAATGIIPIVFTLGGDPVRLGIVSSLNQPGGNVTGVSLFSGELLAKRVELARELLSNTDLLAVLVNPTNPENDIDLKYVQEAAHTIGQSILVLGASKESDFPAVFATLAERRARALLVGNDVFFNSRRDQLVALATRDSVPMIHFAREAVQDGGLMSYGSSIPEMYRLVGAYTGRILKGEKPANLPVLQPSRLELVINLKIAKALGLTVPTSILLRADEVIE
jgi:putative ABC transport system substrate-binding protein